MVREWREEKGRGGGDAGPTGRQVPGAPHWHTTGLLLFPLNRFFFQIQLESDECCKLPQQVPAAKPFQYNLIANELLS